MKRAWKAIQRLVEKNAKHRKGFRLQEVTLPFILEQALAELKELQEQPDDPVEMADLLGVLLHYAVKQGWPIELLESYMLEKFKKRFTE